MIATLVAGRYAGSITYPSDTARALGILEEGFRLSWAFKKDVVGKSDAYGQSVIEKFHLGVNMHISGVFKEWITGVLKTITTYGAWAGTGASSFVMGTIGKADTDNAGSLVLTATAGTPAASSPATFTAALCMLTEDFDVDLLFGPEHRVMPFRMQVFPYDSSGTVRYATST